MTPSPGPLFPDEAPPEYVALVRQHADGAVELVGVADANRSLEELPDTEWPETPPRREVEVP